MDDNQCSASNAVYEPVPSVVTPIESGVQVVDQILCNQYSYYKISGFINTNTNKFMFNNNSS